jgi:hypothetical protein
MILYNIVTNIFLVLYIDAIYVVCFILVQFKLQYLLVLFHRYCTILFTIQA